jgi:hypothetical protein
VSGRTIVARLDDPHVRRGRLEDPPTVWVVEGPDRGVIWGFGWRGRIRTFNPLIQSQVPYR